MFVFSFQSDFCHWFTCTMFGVIVWPSFVKQEMGGPERHMSVMSAKLTLQSLREYVRIWTSVFGCKTKSVSKSVTKALTVCMLDDLSSIPSKSSAFLFASRPNQLWWRHGFLSNSEEFRHMKTSSSATAIREVQSNLRFVRHVALMVDMRNAYGNILTAISCKLNVLKAEAEMRQ